MEKSNIVVKKTATKMVASIRSFRIFDFHVFDEFPSHLMAIDTTACEDSENRPKGEPRQFIIQMFGINEQGKTVAISVTDYKPFFYIKVANNWREGEARALHAHLKEQLGYGGKGILSSILEQHKQLYGFTAGKNQTFIKLVFENSSTMNKTKNLWYGEHNGQRTRKPVYFKGIKLELYESNIPPLLRYFHIQNISPSGWIQIVTNRAKIVQQKTTTCDFEYICGLDAIRPLNQKETLVPYKICSFDIEASSSHGDFPVPKKSYKRLATNLVDVFAEGIEGEPREILLQCLYSAFGFLKESNEFYEKIDLVYPKEPPTKTNLTKLIEILLKTTVKDAKKIVQENSEINQILTIDSMFRAVAAATTTATIEDGEDNDSDMESETEEIPRPTLSYGPPQKKIDDKITILEILQSPAASYTRDEKIQFVDKTLMSVLPPLKGDEVTFIGSTFMRYGELEPYMNHCLVLGTCEDVDGAIIETTTTESELLLRWSELIQKENPDIIIGYNIFGFDYEFMFRRAQENCCEKEFLQVSRKMGEICGKLNSNGGGFEIENTKVALASGEYDLRYYKTTGRLQIDMYTYFRRDYNLASYKLDDVAGQFISDDIKRISHEAGPTTHLYSQNLTGLHKNDYIHIEIAGFTSDYYQDGKKFQVLDILHDIEIQEMVKGQERTVKYNVIVIDGHQNIPIGKYNIKWGMAKDDVSPQDIFRLSNGSAADRAIVAKYCIQDCNLVHHLLNKIDVITGYIEMSRICSVPISFLVFRGQGIKLTSYVAKKCREKGTLMPDLEKSGSTEGYEGAIVLPPKCSMYMDNPVACVDYSSLYPSSMISNNLSHDSKVWTKEYDLQGKLIKSTGIMRQDGSGYLYDDLPEYQYVDIEFDTFQYRRRNPNARAEKVKTGTKICRWAQLPNNQKSIMPAILEELLKARSDTRKMIKTEKDPFMQNILDKRQLGYKVTANSLYGQCGAKTSTFYEQDVAASTTATGRMMIIYARRIIEEVYGNLEYDTETHGPVLTKAEYVYGDSVADYTPITIRQTLMDGTKCCHDTFISDLNRRYGNDSWVASKELGKQEKEYCELENVEIWTEKGWTKLHRVIRHKLAPHKKMIRIITDNGIVDVTDDHSLLDKNGTALTTKDCQINDTILLHHSKNLGIPEGDTMDELFEGVKSDKTLQDLMKQLKMPSENESHYDEKINPNDFPVWCFYKFYYKLDKKIIHKSQYITIRLDASSDVFRAQLLFAIVYNVFCQFGIKMKTSYSIYRDEFILTYNPENETPFTNKIIYMKEIPYEGYVYDLTTENHHFAAGIGNLIVHNTDSVFFTFNLQDPKTGEKIRGKKALEITIEIAQDAAKLCTDYLKPPMALAYEKTLMPFILLSKKRYVGMLYEEDPNKGKLKYMGLSLKRRDSCDYLKDVYGGILNILMKENNIKRATEFLDQALHDLIQGKVPMEKLMLTRALKSYYKNPQQIAHKVLADRIAQRDPGNKPKSGDRIKFLFIQPTGDLAKQKKILLGDRIETPEFIATNNLKIDYNYYITNQLMKPIQQLFGLAVEQIWESQRKLSAIKTYKKDLEKLNRENTDPEIYAKKKEKYCSEKVKTLLFHHVLQKIQNEKNHMYMITDYFRVNS